MKIRNYLGLRFIVHIRKYIINIAVTLQIRIKLDYKPYYGIEIATNYLEM